MRRAAAVGLAAAVSLAACGERARLDALPAGPRLKAVAAPRGDTLKLEDGGEVRLAAVESPAPDAPWGEAARAALARLATGRRVDLLYEGAGKDAAGVRTAQVRVVDGPWLEASLLDAGVVRVRPRPGEAALAALLYAHEARARAHGRGLWRDGAYRVRLPDEFGWDDRGLQIVEGRVRRVSSGRGRLVYLDFADDWRGSVSAEIPTRQLRDWRAVELDPDGLRGRLVRVRGQASGFHLAVETPEAVELLDGR